MGPSWRLQGRGSPLRGLVLGGALRSPPGPLGGVGGRGEPSESSWRLQGQGEPPEALLRGLGL